jgi:hypothetical protein
MGKNVSQRKTAAKAARKEASKGGNSAAFKDKQASFHGAGGAISNATNINSNKTTTHHQHKSRSPMPPGLLHFYKSGLTRNDR